MDYTSIKRLGLDHMNIDMDNSYESFERSIPNHTIYIKRSKNQIPSILFYFP